jgi:hypothetical protein
MKKTIGFLKVEKIKEVTKYAVDPRDDKTIFIPVGIYEVLKYKDSDSYYAQFMTTNGEKASVSYYGYQLKELKEQNLFYSTF